MVQWSRLGSRVFLSPELITVSDKSPRQAMSKKSGKSLKEKRAEKKAKGTAQTTSELNGSAKKR